MTNVQHLQSGRLDTCKVQDKAKEALLGLLDDIIGTKTIVWDDCLVSPICLILKHSVLKDRQVVQMLSLQKDNIREISKFVNDNVIFITRTNIQLMDLIADCVYMGKEALTPGSKKRVYLFLVPKKSLICEGRLIEKNVFGSLIVRELPIYLFPVESDVLSLEQDVGLHEFSVDKNATSLHEVAESINYLQEIYGPVPRISGKGLAAKVVLDTLKEFRRSQRSSKSASPQSIPQLSHIILLDRAIDLVSPLATQLTYEGLIDEFYGIKNTQAKFPADKFSEIDGETQTDEIGTSELKKIQVNSSDEIYAELRDKNFNAVGSVLRKHAQNTRAQLEERCSARATVGEMQKFVRQLPQIQSLKRSLAIHTTIAELIKVKTYQSNFLDNLRVEQELLGRRQKDNVIERIEELIGEKAPLPEVLRLISLQSLTNGGLKGRIYDTYIKDLIRTYGLHVLEYVRNLEKVGLIKQQGSSVTSYSTLLKIHRLVIDDDSEIDPRDICFVHSVYAPLSIRVVQLLPSWSPTHPGLTCLPGPTIDVSMPVSVRLPLVVEGGDKKPTEPRRIVLVFFIGGCTFAEISALRFLSHKEDSTTDYLIATTKIINKHTFLKSIMHNNLIPNENGTI